MTISDLEEGYSFFRQMLPDESEETICELIGTAFVNYHNSKEDILHQIFPPIKIDLLKRTDCS